jgi:hypothetical protein
MGRRPIGKAAMTPTEYQRRWRAKVRRRKIWDGNADPGARRPTPKREDQDFWPTPECLRSALVHCVLPFLPPGLTIWEAAAGDGSLSDAIAATGRTVISSDVAPQRPGIMRFDFLTGKLPRETHGAILITNPPFGSNGRRFVRRAVGLVGTHLAACVLLARADHGGSDGRHLQQGCSRSHLLLAAGVDSGVSGARSVVVLMDDMGRRVRRAAGALAHPAVRSQGA